MTRGLAPVAKRYQWSGYEGCAGDKALVPVLVKDHMEMGAFDFKTRKYTLLDRVEPGWLWQISPNARFALWTQLTESVISLRGPNIRVYEIAKQKRIDYRLPEREWKPEDGLVGTWQFKEFSESGNSAVFELWGKNELAVIDMDKGELNMKQAPSNRGRR